MNRLFRIFPVIVLAMLISWTSGCTPGHLIPFLDEDRRSRDVFQEGETAFEAGRYDEAMERYQAFLENSPAALFSDAALYKIGMIHRIAARNNEAMTAFLRLVHEFPNSDRIGDGMVEILTLQFEAGEMDAVIVQGNDFIRTTRAKWIKPALYGVVGDAYSALGDHLSAARLYYRAWYTTSADGDREMARAKLNSAVSHLASGDIQALISGVMDRPMMGVLLYHLGVALKAEGSYDAALEVFNAFVQQFPQQAYYQEGLDQIAAISGQRRYEPYTIGCLLPLSGSYAVMGQRVMDAVELAISKVNQSRPGTSVRLIVRDTRSDPDTAAGAVEKLDQEGVGAILGPMVTAEAAAAKAQTLRIPIMVFTQREGVTDLGDYVFRHFITPSMQVRALTAVTVNQLGIRHFAVLYPDENYGKRYTELFRKTVDQAGGWIVGLEAYDPEGVDFSIPIKKLADRFRSGSRMIPIPPPAPDDYAEATEPADPLPLSGTPPSLPDVGYTPWNPSTQGVALFIPDAARKSGMIVSQLAYYDVRTPFLLGTNLWHSSELLASSGPYLKKALIVDSFFPEGTDEKVQAFVSDFQQTFNRMPDVIEAMAYDSVMMMVETMDQQGAAESRWALKDALLKIRRFEGVSGRTAFSAKGEAEKMLQVLRIKDGQFVLFSPVWTSETR